MGLEPHLDHPPPLDAGRREESIGQTIGRWLHAQLVYRAVVTLRGEHSVFAKLRELRRLERLPREILITRQRDRLAALLTYAAARSPFYRTRWGLEGSVRPEDAWEQLAALPLVTKADLQRHFDSMVARPAVRPTTRKTTGGSTGQAVTVVKDRQATAAEMAASWLAYGWMGVRPGDRAARFWGQPGTAGRRLRFWAADVAMRRMRFSAFAFDAADLDRYWSRCLAFKPTYFYGYVSMLEAFARHVARQGYDGRELGLQAIVTTSEVLGPSQRKQLEDVFGARVQNEYGCGEVGPIAYECEAGSLHVMSENLMVEVLDTEGRQVSEGGSGEVVVTDLNNRAMPLVRYRLGDFGVVGGTTCDCGRGFPLLGRIWGREYDFVEGPSGRRYHGEFFMYLFEEMRDKRFGVDQFQVEQTSETHLDVRIVVSEVCNRERLDAIGSLVRDRLPGIEVTVTQVMTIPRSASGKLRLIVNNTVRPAREEPSDVG